MNDELINEKFSGLSSLINAHFSNVNDKLEAIEKQTVKTNGRVTELEDAHYSLEKRVDHYIDTRVAECPQLSRIQKIETDLTDAAFFFRHPKLFVAILVVIVILTLGTLVSNDPLDVFKKEPAQIEQVE